MKPTSPTPPRRAERFISWFIREDMLEETLGDLEECFHVTREKRSLPAAKFNYYFQVITYFRPFAIRKPNFLKYIKSLPKKFPQFTNEKEHWIHSVCNEPLIQISLVLGEFWI